MLVSTPATVRGWTRPVRSTRVASSRCSATASRGVGTRARARLALRPILGRQLEHGRAVLLAHDVGARRLALDAERVPGARIEAIEVQRAVHVAAFPQRPLGQP